MLNADPYPSRHRLRRNSGQNKKLFSGNATGHFFAGLNRLRLPNRRRLPSNRRRSPSKCRRLPSNRRRLKRYIKMPILKPDLRPCNGQVFYWPLRVTYLLRIDAKIKSKCVRQRVQPKTTEMPWITTLRHEGSLRHKSDRQIVVTPMYSFCPPPVFPVLPEQGPSARR